MNAHTRRTMRAKINAAHAHVWSEVGSRAHGFMGAVLFVCGGGDQRRFVRFVLRECTANCGRDCRECAPREHSVRAHSVITSELTACVLGQRVRPELEACRRVGCELPRVPGHLHRRCVGVAGIEPAPSGL